MVGGERLPDFADRAGRSTWPRFSMRARTAGSASAVMTALSRRSTMGLGVPFVVHSPCQNEIVSPGMPDSIMVGVSGAFGQRCSSMTAKALNRPACTFASVCEASRQDRSIWPPIRSWIAGARAAIRHVLKMRAGLLREKDTAHVAGAAGADGAERDRLGIRLHPGNQLGCTSSVALPFCRRSTAARRPTARLAANPSRCRNRANRSRRADMARPVADADRVAVGRGMDDAAAAIVPLAPVTFSTTTVWPSGARIASATMRASVSVGPPAESRPAW